MLKIVTVVGARPQFIKAAAVSRAIRNHYSDRITEVLVHTGQHYDPNMSDVFFTELGLEKEKYNLGIGSSSHAKQTASMMIGVEEVFEKEKPDMLLLYGDTNSTVAAALVAAKLDVPVVHVEGGVRSYNKRQPEEINRLITDHLSTLVFTPTQAGMEGLRKEGFDLERKSNADLNTPCVYLCGDIMYDNSLYFSRIANERSALPQQLGIANKPFALVTIHRPENTDRPEKLRAIFETILELSAEYQLKFVVPLHPRTRKMLPGNLGAELLTKIEANENVMLIDPLSFLDITCLESQAEIILTDSGGVQKEAYFFRKPCLIMLHETPWVELIETGSSELTAADPERMKKAFKRLYRNKELQFPSLFGDGRASEFICEMLLSYHSTKQ